MAQSQSVVRLEPLPARGERPDPLAGITEEVIETFQRDGAVWLPGFLSPGWMRLIGQGVQRNINSPGPLAKTHFAGQEGEYFDDYSNYHVIPEYQRLLADSPLPAAMAKLMRSERVWLFTDQIFIKENGFSRRTRWHQDIPWWLPDGDNLITAWIALSELSEAETLEYVRGSASGPIYDHKVSGMGDTLPDHGSPPIPDVESEREKWPIVSHANRPGDVLVFHPQTLHGGGEMQNGGSRRSLSLRFFGDGTRYVERPLRADPEFPGVSEMLQPGDPLIHPWFPEVHPAGGVPPRFAAG